MAQTYKIRQLADEFGLTLRAIRFYQDRGLLTPQRRGTVRLFSESDRARLGQIVRMTRIGLTLTEVIHLIDRPDGDPEWSARLAEREKELEKEVRVAKAALAEVRAMRASMK